MTPASNAVSIVLPVDGFVNVARLVTGGFASQLGYGYEAVDDLQLAIELILRSVPVRGERATVSLAGGADGVEVAVGPFDPIVLERQLRDVVRDGLDLASFLSRLVDSVEVAEGPAPALVMRRKLEATPV